MAEEYQSTCKDCGKIFGYSEASLQSGSTRGLSRPERCSECRKTHAREGLSIGVPQIRIQPLGKRRPDKELPPGRLGRLSHPDRVHEKVQRKAKFGRPGVHIDFGISDDDIRLLIEKLHTHQVAVVVGPTGSGKSTFLPYRLMVPPDGIVRDMFTRYGQIVVTQPRIQATRNIAGFVARDLHGSSLGAGFDVGFRHSGAPASDWRNKLVFVTDGTLINWIVGGQTSNLSVIMIDEAHERSLNIDLILGLLKRHLPRFPQLKLIIASATINAELFQNYFGGPDKVALLKFKGLKQHKVDAYFPDHDDILKNDRFVTSRMAAKIKEILLDICQGKKSEGDILGFLPGEAFIEDCADKLREMIAADPDLRPREINVYPLYAQLPIEQQDLALAQKVKTVSDKVMEIIRRGKTGNDRIMVLLLDINAATEACQKVKQALFEEKHSSWAAQQIPAGVREFDSFPNRVLFTTHENFRYLKNTSQYVIVTDRRVIISTNIAETSLTVDGIVYVVDSGLINEATWDGEQSASNLQKRFHSRAGCIQRMGRAGRVRDGEAHMLYTDDQFENDDTFTAYTVPEIQRSSVDQVILKAKAAGVNNIENFDWIEPPPEGELKRAPTFLKTVGALDDEGDITDFGLELETFITEVPIAGLLVAADTFACGIEMATLAALLPLRVQGGLMEWNRNWDAASKCAVRQIRQNLAAPCCDDVEFLLKLYAIHAEAVSHDQDQIIRRLFFLNTDQLCNKVAVARDQFLEMLAIGKKSIEDRPINFAMLDRLRIILLVSLPDSFIYRTDSTSSTGFLTLDGSEAAIKISDESILAAKPPDVFTCLNRRINRTREGTGTLFLSVLVRIEPAWLEFRNLTSLRLAMAIHKVLEPRMQSDRLGLTRHNLFLDVHYPIGAVFQISRDEQGKPLSAVKVANPPFLVPVIVDGKSEPPVEPADLSVNETGLFPQGQGKQDDDIPLDTTDMGIFSGVSYETEPFDDFHDKELSDSTSGDSAETVAENVLRHDVSLLQTEEIRAAASIRPAFVIPNRVDGSLYKVCGFELTDTGPKVLFEPAPFNADSDMDIEPVAGEIVKVKPVETIEFPGGEKSLRVVVKDTGAEFIVDSQGFSFSGRWELVNVFRELDEFDMQIEQKPGGALRLTCLPIFEERMRGYSKTVKDGSVQARIVGEQRKNRFTTVLLDNAQSPAEIYWGAQFTKENSDRNTYTIGSVYTLMLDRYYGDADVYLPAPPPELLNFVEKEKVGRRIFWNRHRTSLHTRGPMTSETREKLLALGKIQEHTVAIKRLYLESNQVRLYRPKRGFSYKGNKLLEQSRYERDSYSQYEIPDYKQEESLTGRVVAIFENNVLVKLDRGGVGSIGISKLSPMKILDPREVVYADQEIDVIVIGISKKDADKIRIDLKLKGFDRPVNNGPSLGSPPPTPKKIALDRSVRIPKSKLGLLFGKGFSHLNKVKEKSECLVQWNDEGTIFIRGISEERLELATAMIRERIPEMEIVTA